MHESKPIDNRNYRSLVLAGIGTIGKALVTLGGKQFSLFEHIYAIDLDGSTLLPLRNSGITCVVGDIGNSDFLNNMMSGIPGPSLFVNLCSGTDNIRIRNSLTLFNTAYLDTCASITRDSGEYRFSRLMPYTYKKIDTNYPHWLCWGINPGLVEIITRRILRDLPDRTCSYDVAVYEFDRLQSAGAQDRAAVGWCPEALVEEIMLSPTMEVVNSVPREYPGPGTRDAVVNWGNQPVAAKIVGHEDIWNLAEVPAVKNVRFYYSLCSAVMNILKMNSAETARNMLYIPVENDTISGLEQVAVQVHEENMAEPRTLVWTEKHEATWMKFGVNAVQYQTAKSLLLAILLLQCTEYGLVPLSCNASNLPISSQDWHVFEHFMQELDIIWRDGADLNLHVCG